MASIDYQEARKEIIRMFSQKEASGRKIIFWYDPPANFKDDIVDDNYDCCKMLYCDRNEFAIKKTIEHDDVESNYLVYIPSEKPADNENWLLDILMYSDEYYADTVALTMRRLGLSNTDLRRVIELHAKFFDADSRTKKLSSFVTVNDEMKPADLRLAMMCVLVKAASRSIESVLTELVFEDTEASKYAELKKHGFEEYLWDEICRYYNYEGDLKIGILIKRFMFTALLEQKAEFDDLPSFYDQFIIQGQGKMDAKFFVDKIKTDKRYMDLQAELAMELKIEGLLVSRNITCMQTADVFECIDADVIKKISASLVNGSLDYSTFEKVISERINSLWYEMHSSEYEMLESSMAFFKKLDAPIPMGLLATDYIHDYTDNYYLVDTYYRRICANYNKIEDPITELEDLMKLIESTYQYKFLDSIGRAFSDSLEGQKEWVFPGIKMSRDFYQNVQKKNYKKCFVIISDGFRYEIGRELYEKIKSDSVLKGSEEIDYAVSMLPSETRFGMASLLPHRIMSYVNKMVKVDSLSTIDTDARDAVLKNKKSSYAAIRYEKISSMTRSELRTYMADKSMVYIYHNVMDDAGEHNESKVFDFAENAVEEILSLIRKLYNNLQISNFYVTADHGFIYRRNEIEESQKYGDIMTLRVDDRSKRYIFTDDESVKIPYTLEFEIETISNGSYRAISPYGYDLFKTSGKGLRYIHGGASLQEIIVPIIHISELRASGNKEALTPVGVRLKSITRKITNRSFTLEFEQYEKVEERKQAISCETYLVDENGNKVSGEYRFIAASESDDVEARCTKIRFNLMNIEFDRSKRYYLILKNIDKPDEYIEREQFMIDILQFKML
ncbi:MAG: BREX-1 system phosphatase PglZ type A [Lachnospiraceae bacterium]|nr:BREX-1 system phosphatase PglZ type A [Lachnospiraceae bacterium]